MSALPQWGRLAEYESKSSLMGRVLLAGFHDDVPGLEPVDVYPMRACVRRYTGHHNGLQSGRYVHEPILMPRRRPMAPSIDCFPMRRTRRAQPSATLHRRTDMEADQQWVEVGVSLPPIVDRHVHALCRECAGLKLPRPTAA